MNTFYAELIKTLETLYVNPFNNSVEDLKSNSYAKYIEGAALSAVGGFLSSYAVRLIKISGHTINLQPTTGAVFIAIAFLAEKVFSSYFPENTLKDRLLKTTTTLISAAVIANSLSFHIDLKGVLTLALVYKISSTACHCLTTSKCPWELR